MCMEILQKSSFSDIATQAMNGDEVQGLIDFICQLWLSSSEEEQANLYAAAQRGLMDKSVEGQLQALVAEKHGEFGAKANAGLALIGLGLIVLGLALL